MKTKTFAQTLLAWRRKMKLNRVAASHILEVPYRTLQDWEGEKHTPNAFVQSVVKRLIEFYPVSRQIRDKRAKAIAKRWKGVPPYTHEQLMGFPHGTSSKTVGKSKPKK